MRHYEKHKHAAADRTHERRAKRRGGPSQDAMPHARAPDAAAHAFGDDGDAAAAHVLAGDYSDEHPLVDHLRRDFDKKLSDLEHLELDRLQPLPPGRFAKKLG